MLRFCQGQMAVPEWFNRNLNGIHVTQKVLYIYTHWRYQSHRPGYMQKHWGYHSHRPCYKQNHWGYHSHRPGYKQNHWGYQEIFQPICIPLSLGFCIREEVWVQQASGVIWQATLGPLLCQLSSGGDATGAQDHWKGWHHDGVTSGARD